jgi:hypothetical protein
VVPIMPSSCIFVVPIMPSSCTFVVLMLCHLHMFCYYILLWSFVSPPYPVSCLTHEVANFIKSLFNSFVFTYFCILSIFLLSGMTSYCIKLMFLYHWYLWKWNARVCVNSKLGPRMGFCSTKISLF